MIRFGCICIAAFLVGLFVRLGVGLISENDNSINWNGGKYYGDNINGIPNGEGEFRIGDMKYIGSWTDGNMTSGQIVSPDYVYDGEVENFEFNGYGSCLYSSGVSYYGYWQNNLQQGLGRYIDAKGNMNFAFFENGIPVEQEGQNIKYGENVYGIDVSKHQGVISWQDLYLSCNDIGGVNGTLDSKSKYIQPVLFALVKSTEGSDLTDSRFEGNYSDAKKCGILRGAYHFLSILSSGKSQAENYINNTLLEKGDFPPILDIEKTPKTTDKDFEGIIGIAKEWIAEIEKYYGVAPIIYTNKNIHDFLLNRDPVFKRYDFWLANPGKTSPTINNCVIWQFSHHGKAAGIKESYVDVNMFMGTYKELLSYIEKKGIK